VDEGPGGGPLLVTVTLEVKEAKIGEAFGVKVDVKNASKEDVTFKAMSASYAEHFFTTIPHLRVVLPPVDKNFPKSYTLAPGKSWERAFHVDVLAGASSTLGFQLGFNPIGFARTAFLSAPLEIRVAGGEEGKGSSPLEVTAVPSAVEVRSGEKLELALEVKNVSSADRTFTVHGTSWAREWMSSDPLLTFSTPNVRREIRKEITLKPGESWKKNLTVWVKEGEAVEAVTFRMVFRPVHSSTIYVSGALKLIVKK